MKDRVLHSCVRHAVVLLLMFSIAAPAALAQANVHGQWSTLPYLMPINPVHVALMYNGKVLVVSGSGNDPSNHNLRAAVWDPAAGTITVQTIAWDMFCNGMVVLPDGRPFINGGTVQYDPFYGSAKSSVFDPATNTFTDVQNMAHGRWYPTVTTLGDGRILTFSGLTETGGTDTAVEIYTVGTGWSPQYTASWTPPLYPRMHLLPNGKVFYSGSGTTSRLFDPSAHTWSSVATTIYSGSRTYGSSVLLPLTPANSYDPKVMILGGANGGSATATTEIIDMGAATPKWQSGPSMSQGRIEMNAVLLPDGKVLAVGGSVSDEDATTKSLNADLFDLTVPAMSSAGANAYARLYHSNALLMPDATVWFAGGNPVRGSYEPHMEIYQPPYLFNADGTLATRPTITSVPATISWGGSFTVTTPDAENIASVVLIRPGAPTHAFDMDQREVGVSFTKGSGTLTVTAPPNGNIAPPGYYLLFLLNNNGVPSVAKFTKLGAGLPAPTVSAISPNTGTATGGTAVTITGTNFRTGATVSLGGTAATGVTVASATSITATTPAHSAGAVTVTVTNTDNQSASLNNGYTYTAVNPAPTVSAINPTSGTANGGTTVTITGTGFLAGATVNLGGTSATGVTVVNGTSITATTAAHAAGAVSVVVTNTDAQSGTLNNGYTYNGTNPAPTVTSINPTSGTTGGGTSATITGTGFLAGATVTFGGTAATGVTVVSSTSITATTPAHAAGAVNVVVTNTDAQSGTRTNGYTYTTSTGGGPIAFVQVNAATPPGSNAAILLSYNLPQTSGNLNLVVVGWNDTTSTVSSVSDSRGNTYTQAGTTVTGTGLRQAIYYAKNIAGGSNTVTAAFYQAANAVDVRILEYSGLDTSNPLDVTAGAAGNGVSPNSGAATTTSANELIFGAGTTAAGFSAAGAGFIYRILTADGDIAEDKVVSSTGSYSAVAPSSSARWVMQMATFRAAGQGGGNPAPTVSAINPSSGTVNGGTAVTITGTGFLAGATVQMGGASATGVTVLNSTSITATSAAHAAGAVSVVVTNTDAQSGALNNGYTYTTTNPAPTVSSITPNSGTTGGGTSATITGTGFLAGATVQLGGTSATGVTVLNSTSITATTPAHAAGAVSVVVTNTDAQSGTLTNGFTYTTSTGGGGPVAFVQVNAATPQVNSASVPVTFALAQTAGNLNLVVVGWNDTTSTVSSVSDSRGNTYAQAGTTVTGTGLRQAIYYAKNIAGGSNTVTAAFNQAANAVDVRILEYSGLDTSNPLDVTAGAAGNGVSPNSGAATTTSANELIFGAGTTAAGFSAAGAGFIYRILTADGDIAEDKVVSSTGSYSAVAPSSSARWVMQMATFRAAQ